MARRVKPTERQRAVLLLRELLEGKAHTRQSIAELLDVSLRTADRWMKVFERLPGVERARGRPIITYAKAWGMSPDGLALSSSCLRGGLVPVFGTSSFGRRIADVIERFSEASDERVRRKIVYVAHGREEFVGREEAIDLVVDAVMRSCVLRFEYRDSAGPVKAYRVQPLSIVVSDRQIHVVAREGSGAPACPYRLRNMSRIAIEPATFPYPTRQEYDPDVLLAPSLGVQSVDDQEIVDVKLRLTNRWAAFARGYVWHDSQRLVADAEGVIVSWTLSRSPELDALISSFGADAEVLAPEALRLAHQHPAHTRTGT
jgi:predicted DNA-binding transcriptional regulator YafY